MNDRSNYKFPISSARLSMKTDTLKRLFINHDLRAESQNIKYTLNIHAYIVK